MSWDSWSSAWDTWSGGVGSGTAADVADWELPPEGGSQWDFGFPIGRLKWTGPTVSTQPMMRWTIVEGSNDGH